MGRCHYRGKAVFNHRYHWGYRPMITLFVGLLIYPRRDVTDSSIYFIAALHFFT